ncbi:MAG: response regulator [Bacteroidales bacterium]|nr:response regulator [Bacteroidales bacterium]
MKKHIPLPIPYQTKLRKKAEAELKKLELRINKPAPDEDIIKVIHELQVHQIELELQNEELLLAKEKAELAEKKYTDLYESAPSGYLTLSKEGDILELNNSAAMLLHKERDQLINNRLALFISDDTRAVFNKFLQKLDVTTDKQTCEIKLEKEGFYSAYVSVDGILSKGGETILLSMVDITKSKQAEESLRELEVARESLKFKQNFLANMSHEIRTPLTGVLGMIDILENTKLTIEQKDYISTLKHSGENLRTIINQVLNYSKIEAGKVKLVPSVFKLHSLFCETKTMFKGRTKTGVNLSIQSDPDIPEFIYADKKRISQIITNLVANAVKFTPKGSILLSSHLLSPDASGKQVIIKIAVTDTGIGIPHDKLKKLFVPFSQIDDKDTREYEGTGLGLSICKELAILLGGKIGVSSIYHKGSTFWFIFPAQVSESPQKEIPDKQNHEPNVMNNDHQPRRNLRILFADDKVVNQKVISLMLTNIGHVVTLASNGQQALQAYETGKFDLILMDIQMPVMDGITATQKLKKKFKNPPPIVGLSASAFEGDREKYLSLGMDDYITKPVNEGEFKKLISRL